MASARDDAIALLRDLHTDSVNAAVIVASALMPGPKPDKQCMITVEDFGAARVLHIAVADSCSALARAGLVAAIAARDISTLLLLGEGICVDPLFAGKGLAVVGDHINLLGESPLIGPHDPSFGPRFPDMSEPYSKRLLQTLRAYAPYPACTYAACPFEHANTPEMRARLAHLGAHVAGPWLVPELLVARQGSMEVLALVAPLSAHYGPQDKVSIAAAGWYAEFKEVSARLLRELGAGSRTL